MGQERDSKKLYLGQEIFIFPDNVPWRDGGTLPRTTGQNAGFYFAISLCEPGVYCESLDHWVPWWENSVSDPIDRFVLFIYFKQKIF